MDIPAARALFADWPTEIVCSGFVLGQRIRYPAVSIQRDFGYVPHHPIVDAYTTYMKMPYDRPTWDLTSVLYAVRPQRGYFGLSEAGHIRVDEKGKTHFQPQAGGRHRWLRATPEQCLRVREVFVQLASQPPGGR